MEGPPSKRARTEAHDVLSEVAMIIWDRWFTQCGIYHHSGEIDLEMQKIALQNYRRPSSRELMHLIGHVQTFRESIESHLSNQVPTLSRVFGDEACEAMEILTTKTGDHLPRLSWLCIDENYIQNDYEMVMDSLTYHYSTRIQWGILQPKLTECFLNTTPFPNDLIPIILSYLERCFWDTEGDLWVYCDDGNLRTDQKMLAECEEIEKNRTH